MAPLFKGFIMSLEQEYIEMASTMALANHVAHSQFKV